MTRFPLWKGLLWNPLLEKPFPLVSSSSETVLAFLASQQKPKKPTVHSRTQECLPPTDTKLDSFLRGLPPQSRGQGRAERIS